jgi:hypothetical protein
VLLWFIGTACVAAWFVFHDRRFPYRALAVGAVAPDVVDGITLRGAGVLHSMVTAMALLVVVVLVTIGRRAVRRPLLAVVIGVMMHLVFDAAFADGQVFWWPLGGWSFNDAPLPSVERGLVVGMALEVAGAAMLWWLARRQQVRPWAAPC